jgi:hypothetical protein
MLRLGGVKARHYPTIRWAQPQAADVFAWGAVASRMRSPGGGSRIISIFPADLSSYTPPSRWLYKTLKRESWHPKKKSAQREKTVELFPFRHRLSSCLSIKWRQRGGAIFRLH